MSYTFEKRPDQYSLIVEGEYEVTLELISEASTMSGKKKLDIAFRIRQDVEQEHQNRVIYEAIWQEKDTNYYNRKRLNQLLGSQEVTDGTTFNSIQEIIDTLKNAKLRVKVIVAFDDYKKTDVNKIAYYSKTQKPNKKLGDITVKDTKQATNKPQLNDDDLPF
jgi:hypothetical protein